MGEGVSKTGTPCLHSSYLPYSTLLPRQWAAIRTAYGCAHRHLTSPFVRAAVLAMSGTRRVYHYPPVQVIAMRLARTHSRQVFSAPILPQSAGTFLKVILYSPLRRSSWRTVGSAFRFRLYRVRYPDCWI